MSNAALDGRRILLVEDEVLIAMLLEASLQDHGCEVVGPFARLADAVRAIETEQLDAALMDVNLAGEFIYPAAEMLWRKSVPFVLISGYGERALPEDRRAWTLLSKPFEMSRVLATLAAMITAITEDGGFGGAGTAPPTFS